MAATTIPSPTDGSIVIQGHLVNLASTGIIAGDIWSYSLATSPWANLLPRGEFKQGVGPRIRTMHFNRAMAGSTGDLSWTDHNGLGFSSAATGNVPPDISAGARSLPNATTIQATQQVDEYGLRWAAWESPRFDVRDAIFTAMFLDQFSNYYQKVKEAAAYAWERQMRNEYFAKCGVKILLGAPESATPTNPYADLSVRAPQSLSGMTGYTAAQLNMTGNLPSNGYSAAHSVLTNGVAQDWRAELLRLGAGKNTSMLDNFPLVTSPEQQFYMLHEPGMRTDLRFDQSATLLKALGPAFQKSWLGYNFVPDVYAPRFTLAGAPDSYSFTEVSPITYQAGSLTATITSAATYDSGNATEITVGSGTTTTGLVANNVIQIQPTSASDESYSGYFTVIAVTSSTTAVINKAFTSTATGVLTFSGNGEAGAVPNPSYKTAPYEMSFIVFPQVMEVQTLDYPTTLGQGTSFVGQPKPLGTARWVNIPNEDSNPDGTMGYFRGIFEYAAKPAMTEIGVAILHRRAAPVTLASPSFAVTQGLGWFS